MFAVILAETTLLDVATDTTIAQRNAAAKMVIDIFANFDFILFNHTLYIVLFFIFTRGAIHYKKSKLTYSYILKINMLY